MKKVTFTLDGGRISAPASATILAVARDEGIAIPTLCSRNGFVPSGACLLCVVRDRASGRMIPACATRPVDGQEIETSGAAVLETRRRSVEMLLSDHTGDCEAPCVRGCPGGVDIPRMIREIAAGRPEEAAATMRRRVALPASLSWICAAPCERSCRRGRHDGPLAICLLKRYAAGHRAMPEKSPPSGRSVAIVGGGTSGLSAAWFLLLEGHACRIIEEKPEVGGVLRFGEGERPPAAVLEREIASLVDLGAEILPSKALGTDVGLDELHREYDAVVLATGAAAPEEVRDRGVRWGLETVPSGIAADTHTFRTSRPRVFATGSALRPFRHPASAAAMGRETARSVHLHLTGEGGPRGGRGFSSVIGSLREGEIGEYLRDASPAPPVKPSKDGAYDAHEAGIEAQRCLHCDCRKKESCLLRAAGNVTGARQSRYGSRVRPPFTRLEAGEKVVFEPGKCIRCGLCLQAAAAAGGAGLAFLGRGLEMAVGPPFDRSLDASLGPVGKECATVCPTGAISLKSLI